MMLTSTLKVLQLLWSFATLWMVFNNIMAAKGSTCGPPTPPYGSVIIHPSVQGQHKNGSLVLFGCKQGFYLVGPPLIKCTGNTWTKIKFRCIGFCPDFRHILNGQVLHVSPKVGKAAVEFRCNEKYRLIGRTRLECVNGRWNAELPFCKKLKSCERLRAPANGTLYGDDITHGAKVSFTCLTGFELFGLQTITCDNGAWSGSVPSCKAYCMRIRAPSNGRKHGVLFSHGNVVSFECKTGYNLVGDRVLWCLNGKWNSTVPVCNVMLCPRPVIPSNSYIIHPRANQDSYIHGTKLFLACLDGHYLIGSPIMDCNQTEWISMDFSCIASCPVLGSIKNGIVTPVTLKGGGEVKIKCHTNHTLVGSPSLICENGRWNDSLPTCGAPCDEPAIPAHGWKSNLDYRHGRSVKFYCSGKYDRIGVFSITCNDGTWDNQVPVCKARCSDPGSPSHGRRRGDIFRHHSWVRFLCDTNYQLEGDQWIQCVDGSWSGRLPKCKAPCSDPGIPYQGNRIGQDFRHDRTVRFTCPRDYVMEGVSEIRCSAGKWSNNKPSCKTRCRFMGRPEHGFYLKGARRAGDMIRHGERISYRCFTGYTLIGANMQECDNGRWTNDRPACKASCRSPGGIDNGRKLSQDYSHGKIVRYECDPDYTLEGENRLTCNDGTWNFDPPKCRDCGRPLGMENSNIPDAWIRSPYGISRPKFARLNGDSAWCITRQTFLQIDLRRTYKMTAIATQGGAGLNRWVERYKVSFNIGSIRVMYSESGSQKVIEGNKDASSIVKYWFNEPFVTKAVRIYPVVGASTVCLRAEIYGCDPRPDCILVGSSFWGLWVYRSNSHNYYQAFITKLNATHLDFALKLNNHRTRSYRRTDPVLIIDKIPEMKDITVNSQVIAVHKPHMPEWYRVGKVTDTSRTSVHVTFHDGQRRWVRLQELRLVRRPRFCNDGLK